MPAGAPTTTTFQSGSACRTNERVALAIITKLAAAAKPKKKTGDSFQFTMPPAISVDARRSYTCPTIGGRWFGLFEFDCLRKSVGGRSRRDAVGEFAEKRQNQPKRAICGLARFSELTRRKSGIRTLGTTRLLRPVLLRTLEPNDLQSTSAQVRIRGL